MIVIDNSKYMLETLLVRKGATLTREEDEPLSPQYLAIIEAPDGVYQLRGRTCPFHCTTKALQEFIDEVEAALTLDYLPRRAVLLCSKVPSQHCGSLKKELAWARNMAKHILCLICEKQGNF